MVRQVVMQPPTQPVAPMHQAGVVPSRDYPMHMPHSQFSYAQPQVQPQQRSDGDENKGHPHWEREETSTSGPGLARSSNLDRIPLNTWGSNQKQSLSLSAGSRDFVPTWDEGKLSSFRDNPNTIPNPPMGMDSIGHDTQTPPNDLNSNLYAGGDGFNDVDMNAKLSSFLLDD